MPVLLSAQKADSVINRQLTIADSAIHLPSKYLAQVDSKVDKYYNRITSKTEKALEKLSRWENKIHALVKKAGPEAEQKLFGNNQLTFAVVLEKYKEGKEIAQHYKSQYNEYTDKLSTSVKYLDDQKQKLEEQYVKPVKAAKEKIEKLQDQEDNTAAVQKFIKDRKKQLMDQAIQYIGKSKYLAKINKESYYYVETIKNYKELFNDPKKAEQTALTILNKIPAFQEFMKKNSQLASLFRVPGNYGTAQSIAGLQTRASVNALIQDRIASGGPNAQQQISQNIQAAQAELSKIKDKIMKAGGGGSDAEIPDFKPNMQKTKTFLQRLEYGSNFQFSKQNSLLPTTADIGLNIGYKINDKSVIGLGGSYKMGMGSIQHISITHQGIGLRSYIDWKLKKQFFVTGGFEMNHNSAFKNIQQLQSYEAWQQAGLIGLTKKMSIKTKWTKGTKLQLLYDLLANTHVPISQPVVFRIGYAFK
ncbi:MAG: hypothetical protein ABJA78_00855 [Ferruginibacter sp.]